jgi:hypothetical protein
MARGSGSSPAGAHVVIGTYSFKLREDLPDHYIFEDKTDQIAQGVVGDTTKLDEDQEERLLWRMTDWRGGEGARFWNPDDPTVYRYSEVDPGSYPATAAGRTLGAAANTRLAGQFTGKPARNRPAHSHRDRRHQEGVPHSGRRERLARRIQGDLLQRLLLGRREGVDL